MVPELVAGVTAIIITTLALKTKMTVPLPPAVVVLYSTALSPIPLTDLALATP